MRGLGPGGLGTSSTTIEEDGGYYTDFRGGERERGSGGEISEKEPARGAPPLPLCSRSVHFTRYANSSGRVVKAEPPTLDLIFDRADHVALGVHRLYAAHSRPLDRTFSSGRRVSEKASPSGSGVTSICLGRTSQRNAPGSGCRAEIDGPPGHVQPASRCWPDIAGVEIHTRHHVLRPADGQPADTVTQLGVLVALQPIAPPFSGRVTQPDQHVVAAGPNVGGNRHRPRLASPHRTLPGAGGRRSAWR